MRPAGAELSKNSSAQMSAPPETYPRGGKAGFKYLRGKSTWPWFRTANLLDSAQMYIVSTASRERPWLTKRLLLIGRHAVAVQECKSPPAQIAIFQKSNNLALEYVGDSAGGTTNPHPAKACPFNQFPQGVNPIAVNEAAPALFSLQRVKLRQFSSLVCWAEAGQVRFVTMRENKSTRQEFVRGHSEYKDS
ncbi:hypothetical protein N7449_009193 [Penicillium cf. viridicatum]|uniref:Uncharacterized protein n=1 Tax=Penicillium cf. viridicatum TaxID=2972119 RepID=A0A9W9JEV4_9EURO|nr:hypothetical protein N7449_009193 [Penicillium cf. viridicatum]